MLLPAIYETYGIDMKILEAKIVESHSSTIRGCIFVCFYAMYHKRNTLQHRPTHFEQDLSTHPPATVYCITFGNRILVAECLGVLHNTRYALSVNIRFQFRALKHTHV